MTHEITIEDNRDASYTVTAGELRSFVERYERLDQEKRDISDQQKEVMAEAKGGGYDVPTIKKIVALRRKDASEISEEEALLDMYRSALNV